MRTKQNIERKRTPKILGYTLTDIYKKKNGTEISITNQTSRQEFCTGLRPGWRRLGVRASLSPCTEENGGGGVDGRVGEYGVYELLPL
jgi:hypothetical protein